MLAQGSLGLLLLERQEQERRAAFSNGENIHNLQLHEGAITVIYLDFDIKSGIAQRVDNDIQLINHFPSVHVIIYFGSFCIFNYYFGGYDKKSLVYSPVTSYFWSA